MGGDRLTTAAGYRRESREPTKLELYAPGLGFRPWDPYQQDHDGWERAFLRHCIERKGVDVNLQRQWLIDIGFKPQTIDARREQMVVHSEFAKASGEKRAPLRTLLVLTLIITGVSMIVYAGTGDVGCAAGAWAFVPIMWLMIVAGFFRGGGMSDGPDM